MLPTVIAPRYDILFSFFKVLEKENIETGDFMYLKHLYLYDCKSQSMSNYLMVVSKKISANLKSMLS